MTEETPVLVIEDGNEYLELLERFVGGYTYLQAHSGDEAVKYLQAGNVGLIYLDMCFDRTPRSQLLGDISAMIARHAGNEARAWRFIERNQGLFILDHLKAAGLDQVPILLSHDFSAQPTRWAHLKALYPTLEWVHDEITAQEILSRIQSSYKTNT